MFQMTPQWCSRCEPIARAALIKPTVASSMTAEVENTQQEKKKREKRMLNVRNKTRVLEILQGCMKYE